MKHVQRVANTHCHCRRRGGCFAARTRALVLYPARASAVILSLYFCKTDVWTLFQIADSEGILTHGNESYLCTIDHK
jgi:hypothetical protein